MAVKTAILISGRGSNMAALIAAAQRERFPAEIALVLSNRADAAGLAHAAEAGIPTQVISHHDFDDRAAFDTAIDAALKEAGIELVCLAGFMLLLGGDFVEEWQNRVINIHPSLLPAFRGVRTHERALSAGVRIHGATVHYVRAGMDEGPIIVQAAVPVLESDTAETLAERVLAVEHRLYPAALEWVASGRARVVAGKVVLRDPKHAEGEMFVPPL